MRNEERGDEDEDDDDVEREERPNAHLIVKLVLGAEGAVF